MIPSQRSENPRASWEALAGPWRVAIETAGQSCRDGSIAVGAALTDGAGAVWHPRRVVIRWRWFQRWRSPNTSNSAINNYWLSQPLTLPGGAQLSGVFPVLTLFWSVMAPEAR